MQTVIFLDNEAQLIRYLKNRTSFERAQPRYFSHVRLSAAALEALATGGFSRTPKPIADAATRRGFIQSYSDLLAGFAGRYAKERAWWATDVASKNRFSSRLPMALEQLVLMEKILSRADFSTLLVIGQYWETIETIRRHRARGLKIVYAGSLSKHRRALALARWRQHFVAIYHAAGIWRRVLRCRRELGGHCQQLLSKGSYDCLLKTFIYDHCFKEKGGYREIFFGQLPEFLGKENRVLIFAYVLGDFPRTLSAIKECREFSIIPFEACLKLGDIWQALKQAIGFRVGVEKKTMFMGYDITGVLESMVLEKIQFPQFLHYWATKNLLEKVQVPKLLLTYENYPWERMCILAARERRPEIRISGYQHTVVPESFLNMFVGVHERPWVPSPDQVLTTGEIPREIMSRFNDPSLPMDTSCALRFGHLFEDLPAAATPSKIANVLIAMEITFEAFDMVEYLLKELAGGHYEVRIRTHPALPWARFERKFDFHLEQYPNAHVSKNVALKDDLLWADIILYSGTTVGVEALAVGKPIIHFDRGTILSFDPLFECRDFKWTVSPSISVTKVLKEIDALSREEFQEQRHRAQDYTRRYFFPMNRENLQKFIS